MKKLRTAVVGVGYLGRFHAQKYKLIDNVELVAVCDADPKRAKEIADELKVAAEPDFKNLVGKVDAVTIAASTPKHYEISKFFLQNKIHVHVEKPMTSLVSEAEELCRIAKEMKVKLQVGHVERFNPALLSAKKKLKNPLFIECHRLAPFKPRSTEVSVVLDLMIHDLDVILSLVNSRVSGVSAVGTPVMTKNIDIANARVEFENGVVANVTASRVSQIAVRKFRVFQQDQYFSMDFGSGEVLLLSKTGEFKENQPLPLEQETWNLEKSDALLAETKSFVEAINNDTPCQVTGEDGLVALALAEKISHDIEKRLVRNFNSRS